MARGGNASGRDRAAATMVAAAVLLLAGCNTNPAPVVTETPSALPSPVVTATPSATPSPTPSAPVSPDPLLDALPEGATAPGVAGAIITAEFFLEQYGPMIRTGDTSIWDALSTDECGYCADASQTARDAAEDELSITGGDLHIDSSRTRGNIELDRPELAVLWLVVSQGEIDVDGPGTERDRVVPATTTGLVIGLVHTSDRWLVDGVNPEDPDEVR